MKSDRASRGITLPLIITAWSHPKARTFQGPEVSKVHRSAKYGFIGYIGQNQMGVAIAFPEPPTRGAATIIITAYYVGEQGGRGPQDR